MSSGRAAAEIFYDLPWQSREVVREWLAIGHDLRDALLSSNVLGSGPLVTPRDVRQEQLRKMDRRESAEHEASHAVAASALGLKVESAKINADGSGQCVFAKGGTKLQRAIVLMSPELWIERFRRDAFPYGAKGLKGDHRALAEISDAFILREAMDHSMAILKQNRAIVLATADKIERYGYVAVPW
jgi:hypothetical protein